VGNEGFDLWDARVLRVSFVIKQNITTYLLNVDLLAFSAVGVRFAA
jgi:hypothetical protein